MRLKVIVILPGQRGQVVDFHPQYLHRLIPFLFRWFVQVSSLEAALVPFLFPFPWSPACQGLASLQDLVWRHNLLLSQYQEIQHRISHHASDPIFAGFQMYSCPWNNANIRIKDMNMFSNTYLRDEKSTAGGGVSTSMGSDITLKQNILVKLIKRFTL